MWDCRVCLRGSVSYPYVTQHFRFCLWDRIFTFFARAGFTIASIWSFYCENISLESEAEVGRFEAKVKAAIACTVSRAVAPYEVQVHIASQGCRDYSGNAEATAQALFISLFLRCLRTRNRSAFWSFGSILFHMLNPDGNRRFMRFIVCTLIHKSRSFVEFSFRDLQLTESLIKTITKFYWRLEKASGTNFDMSDNECVQVSVGEYSRLLMKQNTL